MEHRSLGSSLMRVFPEVCFEVEPKCEVDVLDGFTGVRMPPPTSKVEAKIDDLISRLAATAHPGRDGKPPDLVIAVEDIELENRDQPEMIARAVHDAVGRHLASLDHKRGAQHRQKVAEALLWRASFHLMSPMPESYFFADEAALTRAGARHPAKLSADRDWEDFLTADPHYMGVFGDCLENPRKPKKCPWEKPDRDHHPKHYIRYLSRIDAHPTCTDYQETSGGAEALGMLDWCKVFRDERVAPFARALFEDIANALSLAHPFPGVSSRINSALSLRAGAVLRNL
jgi:hypothetical protein